jgi:hypothetical protein
MPRRRQASSFTFASLTNLIAIPLITALFLFVGWYFVTSYRMNQNDITIAEIKKTVIDKTTEDNAARAKIRDDFLASQVKTAEGIAKLDTRLAVAETTQKTQLETLNKIADSMQKLTMMPNGKGGR